LKALSMPPRIKVLEALGAIGDNRIDFKDDRLAIVVSSDGSRRYTVFVDSEKRTVFSTDNGTVYKGYVGYPIISVLMLKGLLPFNKEYAEKLRGINWRSLNEKYKKYFIVEKIVKNIFKKKGGDAEELDKFVKEVLERLRSLNLRYVSPEEIGIKVNSSSSQ
jgi:hypothetical protein